MALTILTAINRVLSRMAEANEPSAYPPDIEALIPDALKKFAQIVAKNPDIAPLLRKDFSIVVTSGTGSLVASLTAAEPMLEEFLDSAFLVTSTGVQLHHLPDRTQLSLKRPQMIPYYTDDAGTLRTRNTDGSLTSLNTTITATAQYVPTIGDVPNQLQELFIDTLALMLKSRAAVPQEQGANA